MDFDDPFVRFLSQLALLLIAASLLALGLLGFACIIDWYETSEAGPGNPSLVRLVKALPAISGTSVNELTNIIGILASAIPLAVTPVCFRTPMPGQANSTGRRLNFFGKVFALLLLGALLISATAYVLLKPSVWGPGHDLGVDGLSGLQDWCKTALRGAVFYLVTLFGLKAIK